MAGKLTETDSGKSALILSARAAKPSLAAAKGSCIASRLDWGR